jgi:hypothetical protein
MESGDARDPWRAFAASDPHRQAAAIQIRIAFLNCAAPLGIADIIRTPHVRQKTVSAGFKRPVRSATRTACRPVRTGRERRN